MVAVAGCGEERGPPAPEAPPPEAPAPEAAAPPPADPVVDPLPAPEPQGEPIDLLRSVPSAVAVSSVYEDRTAWLERLVDGDPESAWNSRSGDLAGAWIEVRVPAEVTVTSIELTAGFTRTGGRVDLFTGNHRVARVRVLRDGARLGEHALDPSSRALQPLPVNGPGGVYRIELLELVPGTRTDWREACVSELRVLGHPGAAPVREGAPALAVGALPDLSASLAPGSPADAATLWRLAELWIRYEDDLLGAQLSTGDPDVTDEEIEGLLAYREEFFRRLSRVVVARDAVRGTALRARAREVPTSWEWSARRADFDDLAPAFVVAAGDDAPLRCVAAATDVCVRLERSERLANWERESNEVSAMALEGMEDVDTAAYERGSEAAGEVADALGELVDTCQDDPRATAAGVLAFRPTLPGLADAEWPGLRAAAGRVAPVCRASE